MRRVFVVGVASLFLLSVTVLAGCDSKPKATIPDKQIDLPKDGPKAAGVGGGKKKAQGPNDRAD